MAVDGEQQNGSTFVSMTISNLYVSKCQELTSTIFVDIIRVFVTLGD